MKRTGVFLSAAAALALLGLSACGGDGDEQSEATATVPLEPTSTPVPTSTPRPTPTPTPVLGPELLSDGSFEAGNLDIWEPRRNERQVIELSTAEARTGNASLHITTPSSEGDWPWVVLQDVFPVEPGALYQVTSYSKQYAFGPVQILFDFHDSQGEFLNRFSQSDWVDATDDWLEMKWESEAPEGAVTGRLIVQLRIITDEIEGEHPADLEIYVDDLSVRMVEE